MSALAYFVLLVVLGGVVSFEDWRDQKIRNRWIAAGLAACAAGLLVSLAGTLLGLSGRRFLGLGAYYLPWAYYPRVLVHLALSLAAAVGLWLFSVWPAGDAKFFALLSWLAVLADPNLPGFPALLFLLILVNIFVPAGLVLAAESLARLALRAPELRRVDARVWLKAKGDMLAVRAREAWPRRFDYLVLAVNLVGVFLLLQGLLPRLGRLLPGPWSALALFLAMTAGWRAISSALSRREVGLAVFAGLCAWTLAGALSRRWDVAGRAASALRMTANFGMFLSVGQALFGRLLEAESLRELRAEGLALGTVLSDETWSRLEAEDELDGELDGRSTDGLTESDARAVRDWARRRGEAGLTVYRTIPFALWIFFGVLLTVSRRVNAVAVLVPFLWRARETLLSAASRWLS